MDDNPYKSPETRSDAPVPLTLWQSLFIWTGTAILIFTFANIFIGVGDDAPIQPYWNRGGIGLVLLLFWVGGFCIVAIVRRWIR